MDLDRDGSSISPSPSTFEYGSVIGTVACWRCGCGIDLRLALTGPAGTSAEDTELVADDVLRNGDARLVESTDSGATVTFDGRDGGSVSAEGRNGQRFALCSDSAITPRQSVSSLFSFVRSFSTRLCSA